MTHEMICLNFMDTSDYGQKLKFSFLLVPPLKAYRCTLESVFSECTKEPLALVP